MSALLGLLSRTLAGPHGTAQARRSEKRRRRQEAELARLLDQQPDPLPSPRAHNLSAPTLPLPQDQSATTSTPGPAQPTLQVVNAQTQSPLFTTLPPELRERIWLSVVGGNVVWLTHIRKRIVGQTIAVPEAVFTALTSRAGPSSSSSSIPTPDLPTSETLPPRPPIHWSLPLDRIPSATHHFPGPPSTIPLLRSSRAIYTEAHPLLYTGNIFAFSSPLTLIYLVNLPILRPQHVAHIKHIRLHWRFLHNPEAVTGCVHAPWDGATWRTGWAILADRHVLPGIRADRGGTFGVHVEVEGTEEEVLGERKKKKSGVRKPVTRRRSETTGDGEGGEDEDEDEDDREGGEWMQAMMAMRGMRGAEVRLEWRIGPVNVQRLRHLERRVKEAWAKEEDQ